MASVALVRGHVYVRWQWQAAESIPAACILPTGTPGLLMDSTQNPQILWHVRV